jgi:hypothetical protein
MPESVYNAYFHLVPLVTPVDKTSNAYNTPWIDLQLYQWCTLYHFQGLIESGDQTMTVETSSDGSSIAGGAMAFNYRSAVTGTDDWSDITAGTSDGVLTDSDATATIFAIEVDPIDVLNKLTPGRYIRLAIAVGSAPSSNVVADFAICQPRYPKADHFSTSV